MNFHFHVLMLLGVLGTQIELQGVSGGVVSQEKLTTQETLFLRRVTEFWKDRDYLLVKKQIEEFLAAHESSTIHQSLYALMGDLFYQEGNYSEALNAYHKISDAFLEKKVLSRHLQCLYLAEKYDQVITLGEPLFQNASLDAKIDHEDEVRFILGDSIFRKMEQMSSDEEGKSALALQAKPYLLRAFNTSYQEKVILPLAEVHRQLKEFEESARLYQAVADTFSPQREELLFQVAAIQMEFDSEAALTTFQQVVDLGQKNAPTAAYQEMVMLLQRDRFSDLIHRSSKLSSLLKEGQKHLLEFCLARSYFKLEQIQEAALHFTKFIEQESENTPYKRVAFLNLIHSAQKIHDPILFDRAVRDFLVAFPKDEEAGKALLLHAQAALKQGDAVQASSDLERLMQDFPDFPGQETILYDQAVLFSQIGKWKESRSALIAYLERFPNSSQITPIYSLIIRCSEQELQIAPEEATLQKKQQLAQDLSQALNVANFPVNEEASYRFLLGQLMFDLHQFSEAIGELALLCQKFPDHPSIINCYLLELLAYQELKADPAIWIPIAEKGLSLANETEHQIAFRLHLFNAYLAAQNQDFAAEQLYQLFLIDEDSVQQENQLWLASYAIKKGDRERALHLFKKVLLVDESYNVHFDPSKNDLEGEVLALGELITLPEKEVLFRSAIELYRQGGPQLEKFYPSILFELGKTCVALKKTKEAFKLFDELISQEHEPFAALRNQTLLERSKLLLSLPENQEEHTQEALSILKDLQIQKELASEPVHLEAAFTYADLRISLAEQEPRVEKALFFLRRIQEDFNSKDDSIGETYHACRLVNFEKDQLFQMYMQCLTAEILRWESVQALQSQERAKGQEAQIAARGLFEEIVQNPNSTPYLKHRAEENIREMRLY